ncbi:MAG: NAD(+)/NADH kinase [Clostridiales bacterium]|nr:NAD(+)/NADH kinase [Clostridiales bacterium]
MSDNTRIINIVANDNALSLETKRVLKQRLEKDNFIISKEFDNNAELIICIGGDGSFLRTVHTYNFPRIPIIGVNTGHLGFFQEISPNQLDEFIFKYNKGDYKIQTLNAVCAEIVTKNKKNYLYGINEIGIRSDKAKTIHLNISLDDSFLERFSGDGLLIATPAGSTAYNYSLGGSIVDPRLNLLQITPLAPINTTAYRSFTSSVIVPPEITIRIFPENTFEKSILIISDGMEHRFDEIYEISLYLSNTQVQVLRLEKYDFWTKVKRKFL